MLLFGENLVERIHGEEGDPLDVQAGDDFVGHSRFPARTPTADSNHQRLNQFLSLIQKF